MKRWTSYGGTDYDVIAEQDDGGGGYEWGHAALLRNVATGELYLTSDSGCSCDAPWVNLEPTAADTVASWQEAVEKLKADRPYNFTDDDVARFAEKLAELRPASSSQMRRPAP